MPTPASKNQINVKVTNGNADWIVINNETQGWKKKIQLNSSGEVIYTPTDDDNTLSSSDKISISANGRIVGNGSVTASSGGSDVEFTGTVDTISQAVNL